jgi:hypothetical protein
MDSNGYLNITNTLAESSRCFTTEDLLTFAEEEQDKETLIQTIENGPRFLQTCEQISGGRKYFVAKKALYHWYVNLNVRLAKGKRGKLDRNQLVSIMSFLRPDGIWTSPPAEYVEFGQQFGLICPILNQNEYVFPIAHILSLMSLSNMQVAVDFLETLLNKQEYSVLPAEQVITQAVEDRLKSFTDRDRYIIVRRQGFGGITKMTLEQIGQTLGGITRERVRQIEAKCLRKMRHPKFRNTLVVPFISYILRGSLILSSNPKPEIKFVAKCLNIPVAQFKPTDLLVLGETTQRLVAPKEIWRNLLDIDVTADYLQSSLNLILTENDMVKIAEALSLAFLSRLTKSQKVYLALKQIGRPAHFERIAETFNFLFPKDYLSDRNVHAMLTREEHGVVWIGIRGTYALKEWGYERPSSTLFKTIAEIVEQKYTETSKPVSSLVIQAEIGKYRKIVNPNSIIFATYFNPDLLRVNEDHFIPKPANESQVETSGEELDRILEEFEKRRKE